MSDPDPRLGWFFDLNQIVDAPTHADWTWDRHTIDAPLDPGDTLADPERTVRLRVRVEDTDETRRERDADAALSDFGSGARWRRRGED